MEIAQTIDNTLEGGTLSRVDPCHNGKKKNNNGGVSIYLAS